MLSLVEAFIGFFNGIEKVASPQLDSRLPGNDDGKAPTCSMNF